MCIATAVNAEVCMTNWMVGKRIKEDVLYNERADKGKEILKNLAGKLTERYSKGWSDRKLLHGICAACTFDDDEIGYAVRTLLTWTHLSKFIGNAAYGTLGHKCLGSCRKGV